MPDEKTTLLLPRKRKASAVEDALPADGDAKGPPLTKQRSADDQSNPGQSKQSQSKPSQRVVEVPSSQLDMLARDRSGYLLKDGTRAMAKCYPRCETCGGFGCAPLRQSVT